MMDIHALKAFLEVAECGSFSLAADRLFITQPAISKRVANLESQLETRLFDRLGKSVLLTESGKVLLPQARKILVEIAEAGRLVASLGDEVRGDLTIVTSHHIGLHHLSASLRHFCQRYHHVRAHVRFTDSDMGARLVAEGGCELAIITLPEAVPDRLVVDTSWKDRLKLMAATHHRLAVGSISREDLEQYSAILPAGATTTSTIIRRSLEKIGIQARLSETSRDYETIRMLVSAGVGWSVLPETMADTSLHICNVKGFSCTRELGVLYHGDRVLSNPARAFLELFKGG